MIDEAQTQIRDMVRQFARRELRPTAAERDRTAPSLAELKPDLPL